MTQLVPLRNLPPKSNFKKGDVFILFGELFGRGYVNGLIDEARAAGMTIVGITVGRRDENNNLRALTDEELAEAKTNLGGHIINVPMMAGFDLDAPEGEPTPTDLLGALTLKTWQDDKLDMQHVKKCREIGVQRFKDSLKKVVAELDGLIPDGANAYFAHTMAGGIPKVKVFLAIANKIYKGRGKRFMSSRVLINSDLGKLILMNFDEVSANSLQYLIEGTAQIRARVEKTGGQVRYSAYGYHGTEILINNRYQWQSYTNYTQGYAKKRLENIAEKAWANGIKATVFNCPEIRTNSSDIFVGVELSLFPLLSALKKENGSDWAQAQCNACSDLLQDGVLLQELIKKIEDYNSHGTIANLRDYEAWPMDNNADLAEVMIGTSGDITALHKDKKELVTGILSSLVLEGTGPIIFNEMANPTAPVLWLNHDIIAKQLNLLHS